MTIVRLLAVGLCLSVAGCGVGGEEESPAVNPQTGEEQDGNRAPEAFDLSLRSDPATVFFDAQLSGSDADNDTLSYTLDTAVSGQGYSLAYVVADTGQLSVVFDGSGIEEISLQYRVSDGVEYSEPATVQIVVESSEDKGSGSAEVPADEYGDTDLAFFDGDLEAGDGEDGRSLPASIDLSGLFPVPGDQGQQGSCVGWSVAYAIKSYHERVEEQWGFSQATVFSPAWVYNQINGGQDAGSRIDHALQLIVDSGAATYQQMPYSDGDYLSQPSFDARSSASAYKASRFARVSSVEQMKAALASRNPIATGLSAYDSLANLYGSDSVYNDFSGELRGGHAVTIVGYDDNQFGGAFKLINSWGTGWGDGGFFWLPYSAVSQVMNVSYVLFDANNTGESVDVYVPPVDGDLPNLEIVTWSATYTPQGGGAGTFQWEVINSGQATAAAGADVNLVLSRDQQIDNTDTLVLYEQIPFELPPGESAYRRVENQRAFTFPQDLQPGEYYMAVWVDDLQEVVESNESDNVSFGSTTTTIVEAQLADLSIESWWVNLDRATGDGELEYRILNSGGAATVSDNWALHLVLSPNTDFVITDLNYVYFERSTFALGANRVAFRDESNPGYFNIGLDVLSEESIPVGEYYMGLWVDGLGEETESNERNNFSTDNSVINLAQSRGAETESTLQRFNGRSLSGLSRQVQKVIVSRNADGKLIMQPSETRVEDSLHLLPGKRMHAADQLVFPRSGGVAMPAIDSP